MSVNKIITAMFSSVIIMLTTACSPIKTLNAVIPENGYALNAAIAYGESSRQKLDVYVPKEKISLSRSVSNKTDSATTAKPVIVFFYGGSWDSGRREDYKFIAEALTSQGFITVIPDYRVYPEVLFPEFIHDAAKAVQWAKAYASKYGGDNNRIFILGHSAGAQIAAMLTLDPQYLAAVKHKPTDLAGMMGLAGPYDFLPLKSARLNTIFGPKDQLWKSQPINFVSGENPPMLLMVGKKDGTVWPRNSYNLAAKIKSEGGQVSLVEFPNYGHIDMAAKLAKPLRGDGDLLKAITSFVKQN